MDSARRSKVFLGSWPDCKHWYIVGGWNFSLWFSLLGLSLFLCYGKIFGKNQNHTFILDLEYMAILWMNKRLSLKKTIWFSIFFLMNECISRKKGFLWCKIYLLMCFDIEIIEKEHVIQSSFDWRLYKVLCFLFISRNFVDEIYLKNFFLNAEKIYSHSDTNNTLHICYGLRFESLLWI